MKSLIVCVSTSHGNTRRVADRMAEVLHADVVEPEAVDADRLGEYDLVGFGSGIYFMRGAAELPLMGYRRPIQRRLVSKGFRVLGSFSCRGFDTVGPLRLVGGLNKGRPNVRDLDLAAAFAARLRDRAAGPETPG